MGVDCEERMVDLMLRRSLAELSCVSYLLLADYQTSVTVLV